MRKVMLLLALLFALSSAAPPPLESALEPALKELDGEEEDKSTQGDEELSSGDEELTMHDMKFADATSLYPGHGCTCSMNRFCCKPPPPSPPSCPGGTSSVPVQLFTQTWANEISFKIDGVTITSGTLGDSQTYTYWRCLAPGVHTLLLLDSFGDGWHGGYVRINNVNYGTTFTSGASMTFSFYELPFAFKLSKRAVDKAELASAIQDSASISSNMIASSSSSE